MCLVTVREFSKWESGNFSDYLYHLKLSSYERLTLRIWVHGIKTDTSFHFTKCQNKQKYPLVFWTCSNCLVRGERVVGGLYLQYIMGIGLGDKGLDF